MKRLRAGFARRVVAGLAVVAAVVGVNLVTAGPAAAAVGRWINYHNTNPITISPSTWHCSTSEQVEADLVAQVCAIRSPSGASVQGAVIARNNSDERVLMRAEVELYSEAGLLEFWQCREQGMRGNSWAVCFGDTIAKRADVRTLGAIKYRNLGYSPWI